MLRAWRVHRYGRPSEALSLDEIDPPEPGPGELRVRASAVTLNWNDIDGCYGRYATVSPPLPYVLGMEVTGVVEATGPDAGAWLGKRVMATPPAAFGGYAEQVVAPVAMSFEVPASLDDEGAAAFFFPFHLGALALHERGRIRAGETLLVHAAAGGIGSAVLQLGVAAGARVLATAGSREKTGLCRELGADLAIDYRREDFVPRVLEATGGRGVDLVCDLVGGEVGRRSLGCLAYGGRQLVVGFSGGIEDEDTAFTPRPLCFGSLSLVGVMLAYHSDPLALKAATGMNLVPRERGDAIHAELARQLAAGEIRPVVGQVRRFEELPEALEVMEARRTVGRTVLRL